MRHFLTALIGFDRVERLRRVMRPRQTRIFVALLIALTLALAGCTGGDEDQENTDEEAGDEEDGGGIYAEAADPGKARGQERRDVPLAATR